MEQVLTIISNLTYVALGGIALWGAFCVILVWNRVAKVRFKNEDAQNEFLDELDEPLEKGDFDAAGEICDANPKAMPQLCLLAIENRKLGFAKVKGLLIERFQRDILTDLEFRINWVNTVIKSAPMIGLFGTVLGMMAAFAKLAGAGDGAAPDPTALANDISFALITTALGLTIAIPLIISLAAINIRIRKMEDLVSSGMTRFMETFKEALKNER